MTTTKNSLNNQANYVSSELTILLKNVSKDVLKQTMTYLFVYKHQHTAFSK